MSSKDEIKLELQKVNSVVRWHASRGHFASFRALLLNEVQLGYRGDFEDLVERIKAEHPEWIREGR